MAGMERNTQVRAVFLSSGLPVGIDAYRRHHPRIDVPDNLEILEKLRGECQGVRLLGDGEVTKAEQAVLKTRQERDQLDGLLVFGAPPEDLISIGLPMVAVERPLEGCTTVPFHSYSQSMVLTSSLPAHRDKDSEVYSSRLQNIAGKVETLDAIARMKGLRILVVTDSPPLGYFEPIDLQIKKGREEYEGIYEKNLRETFGAEIVTAPQQEILDKMDEIDHSAARKVAGAWIREAVALRGANEEEVLKSGMLYLAMKEMLKEHECDAITTEGYGWPPLGYEEGPPSQGLPSSQLCTEGVVATSETLIDCLITQQLGLYITGSAGFMGDYTIDPHTDIAIMAHCEGSFRPYADERRAPYVIRNLPFVDEDSGGACVQIDYPIGETVTVAKISMYGRKLSLWTGETVSGEELFPYWNDVLGRTKLAVRCNARALLENVDWGTFGNHRAAFFGDHRQKFKDLAKLIGFEVVEKDKVTGA